MFSRISKQALTMVFAVLLSTQACGGDIDVLATHLSALENTSDLEYIRIDSGSKSLQLGYINHRVTQLRARLIQLGYEIASEGVYDKALESAVKDYQKSINLTADGKVGKLTLFNLNLTRAEKIHIIKNQLLSMNEVFSTLGSNKFILINIPAYQLYAYENGTPSFSSKVILGHKERQTPLMETSLTGILYNPTWTLPSTIIEKDIFKNGKLDLKYIDDHKLVLMDHQNNLVGPDGNVSLNDFLSHRIKLVQPASNNNALGVIKFQLKDTPDIYMHDTNQHILFERDARALSSGCIRVQKYLDLASWALGKSFKHIIKMIEAAKTVPVRVQAIPVKTVYWMAEVVNGESVLYHQDVYKMNSLTSGATSVRKTYSP